MRSLDIGGELMAGDELSLLASPESFPRLRTLQIGSSTSSPEEQLRAIVSSKRDELRVLGLAAYCVDPTQDATGVPPAVFEATLRRITLFSWDDVWDGFVADRNRCDVRFEEPRTDWDWVVSSSSSGS